MLIAFSGIDGGGKSTQVDMLARELRKRGRSVVVTKAYNDEAKRSLKQYVHTWADEARLFLFQAMHARQYDETVAALQAGAIVIADRWDESYIAYHSNFGPLASQPELRREMNRLAFHGLLPDIGFFIELPVEVARQRRESRGQVEKLENRPDDWYLTIQYGYRLVAVERGWHILDGLSDSGRLHKDILELLSL
jgi:dTMP kinase